MSLNVRKFSSLLLIVSATNAKISNSACAKTETRFYSHDDVQEIVGFIASKDCKLSDSGRNSEYFTDLEKHGCWCNAIIGRNTHGLPIDQVDRSCRKWHTCQKCTQRESCPSDQTGAIFEINYNAKTKSFSCLGDSGSTCSYDKCICTLKLAVEIYSEIKINKARKIKRECSNMPRPMLRFGQRPEEFDRCCQDDSSQTWTQYDSNKEYCNENSEVKLLSEKPTSGQVDQESNSREDSRNQQNLLESLFSARRAYFGGDSDIDEIFDEPTNGAFDENDSFSSTELRGSIFNNKNSESSTLNKIYKKGKKNSLRSNVLITASEKDETEHLMQVVTGDPICRSCTKFDRWNQDEDNLCFKSNPSDPQKYYSCHHGNKVEMKCVNGLVFDPKELACNLAHLV